jgi:hypothetical protein
MRYTKEYLKNFARKHHFLSPGNILSDPHNSITTNKLYILGYDMVESGKFILKQRDICMELNYNIDIIFGHYTFFPVE